MPLFAHILDSTSTSHASCITGFISFRPPVVQHHVKRKLRKVALHWCQTLLVEQLIIATHHNSSRSRFLSREPLLPHFPRHAIARCLFSLHSSSYNNTHTIVFSMQNIPTWLHLKLFLLYFLPSKLIFSVSCYYRERMVCSLVTFSYYHCTVGEQKTFISTQKSKRIEKEEGEE